MAQSTPKLLFRAWSHDSYGTNSRTTFKPGSESAYKPTNPFKRTVKLTNDFGENLRSALFGHNIPQNRFLFFTSSLLFALQFANWRRSEGWTDIHITCINTETATTSDGSPADFITVDELLKKHGTKIFTKSGSLRTYSQEYVALASVVPQAGSCCASFDSLIEKSLFDLYPQLLAVNNLSHIPKLYRAMINLRKFGFDTEQHLSSEKIDVAASLALSFEPCIKAENTEADCVVESHLLSWFLSLRNFKNVESVLGRWLDTHSSISLEDTPEICTNHTGVDDPEYLQYAQLVSLLEGRTLLRNKINTSSTINHSIRHEEMELWQAWSAQSRAEYSARRPERQERGGFRHRRTRHDRSRSPGHQKHRGGYRQRERR